MYSEKEIKKVYVDLARSRREDLAVATYPRTWLLCAVAARMGCSTSTVRRFVPRSEHVKIFKKIGLC